MANLSDPPPSELLAMEGFLDEIQDILKDLGVVAELHRLCKNNHGRLNEFGESILTEGISRGTPSGVLARMIGITKQAVWDRKSKTTPLHQEDFMSKEDEVEESLYTIRSTSLLKQAAALSRIILRFRLLLKRPNGSRLSVFGKEFLVIALNNEVEPLLIASILDVSPSYISLFKQRNKMGNLK